MAGEQIVDVHYRGHEIARTCQITDVGPTSAYLAVDQPMPVGTEIELITDTGVTVKSRVIRVHEKIPDRKQTAGMYIQAATSSEEAATWWSGAATRDIDHPFPEPATRVATDDSSSPDTREAEANTSGAEPQSTTSTTTASDEADNEPTGAVPEQPVDDRKTEVMNAVDIAAITAQATTPEPQPKTEAKGKKRRRKRKGKS